MRTSLVMLCLAALSVFPGACNSKKSRPGPVAESEAVPAERPPAETAKVKAAFALAGPLCTKLARHQRSLARKAGETIDEGWDEPTTFMLAICMSTDYTPEEVRCMSTSVSLAGYQACTAERQAKARAAELADRNPHKIPWLSDLEAGLAAAAEQKKPLLVDVFAEWCMPCVAMEREVFGDPEVAEFMTRHFVNVRLDVSASTDEDQRNQARLDANTLPAVLILDPTGTEVARQQSLSPPTPETFVAWLQSHSGQ